MVRRRRGQGISSAIPVSQLIAAHSDLPKKKTGGVSVGENEWQQHYSIGITASRHCQFRFRPFDLKHYKNNRLVYSFEEMQSGN
ncbi:hypothetical protein F2P81_007302 [Scophthalmus maximus]|uniref:Uncharacterized protein n=1 Tax=Scophthalmus maximus TaxID=52904 RepID=A0A6A4TDY6_SCOMX|nr:hypothetical protein F2P81_007302 [Scophthalmus maximus]